MNYSISHDRDEETLKAKVLWFKSLSLRERMALMCEFTDLILSVNPTIVDKKDAEQAKKGIRIISK